MTSENNERRGQSDLRFPAFEQNRVHITIERADGRRTESVVGVLETISRGGFKALLSEPLPFEEAVTLHLTMSDPDFQISIVASVCWSRPTAVDQWMVGGRFVPHLSRKGFENLVGKNLIERRVSYRQHCRNDVTVQWELDASPVSAVVYDISPGGFCLLCPTSQPAGRRVMISIDGRDESETVMARSAWASDVDEGCYVGCTLLTKESYLRLADLLGEDPNPAGEDESVLDEAAIEL